MKQLYTKPISSPGRTDKFPPPLMRFLRTTPGNRSRGRSKTKSLFLKKKTTTIETKEPSSPKVTCMGQVRVKRSSTATITGSPTKCRCRCWVPHALFCHTKKPCFCSQSVRPNWKCFRFRRKAKGKGKPSKVTESSSFNGTSKPNKESEQECEREEENTENRVNSNAFVSSSSSPSTPPRNALLLMRSKSTPYSSSSLASRFCGSPLRIEETEQPSENQRTSESVSEKEAIKDQRLELKLRFFKELEDSLKEKITESEKVGELRKREETEEGDSAIESRPVALTRCKSERPRTVQKLDSDKVGFY